ncbi:MAG: hypothetical protein WC528_01075 [Patescibacteria group bacterium]
MIVLNSKAISEGNASRPKANQTQEMNGAFLIKKDTEDSST